MKFKIEKGICQNRNDQKVTMKISVTIPESKVIIVGNPGAGKTSIIQQYTNKIFDNNTESTVAASYNSIKIKAKNGEMITLNLWDTAGQEKYRSLIPMYSRNASAALLVTDLSNKTSFETIEEWLHIIKESCPSSCKIYCVGNKTDLEPAFPIDNLKSWAETNKYPLFLTSAKDRETIVPVFTKIADDLASSPKQNITTSNIKVKKDKRNEEHAECC